MFRYSKIEYVNKLKLEYVNGHFSEENNTRGSTYSTVEYAKKKNIIDDDDDGTVWHRLSLLNTIYERYNEQYNNYRHTVYCCINCVLVFAVFTIILLLAYTRTLPIIDRIICTRLCFKIVLGQA